MTDVRSIKGSISPEHYYSQCLAGKFGNFKGNNWCFWNGLCPFHNDRKPGSFFINTKTGAFKCFSCGASGGDIIDFHMKKNNQTFKEAVNALKGGLS